MRLIDNLHKFTHFRMLIVEVGVRTANPGPVHSYIPVALDVDEIISDTITGDILKAIPVNSFWKRVQEIHAAIGAEGEQELPRSIEQAWRGCTTFCYLESLCR